MGMKVTQTIDVYEVDGEETKGSRMPTIGIENHHIWTDRVILVMDGKRYTLIADDLRRAITNATNHK